MQQMCQLWKDASPTTCFPFESTKGPKIKHTWADVREGLRRDGVSGAMHKSMSHITPTVIQSELIKDEIKKEQRLLALPALKAKELEQRGGETTPRKEALPSPRTPRQLEAADRVREIGRVAYLKEVRNAPISNDSTVIGFQPTSRNYGVAYNPMLSGSILTSLPSPR